MSRFDSSHVNSASNKQAQQNVASRGYNTWLLVDLCLMLLVTVVLFIVLLTVETLSDFLKLHHYLLFIFLILGVILLGLILFVHKIRSQYVAVRLLLAIVVVLWSVSLAIAFTSFEWAFLWMSLVITIVLTITTVVLALKLPPLSEKGFILFIVMSIVFATLAFITKFVNYFIPETSNLLKSIICNFGTVFAVSFIVLTYEMKIIGRHGIERWARVTSIQVHLK
uniref:Uncharacterized protein n=1 Tax=Trichobilharzia regenti TaxID=157069 RepID=A0AA85J3N9_TRIRE|nr:unnamed protein product [Trichobilharzia regenti]